MSFFDDGGTVPVPFNIIPTPKSIFYLLIWVKNQICSCSKKQQKSQWQSLRKIVRAKKEKCEKYQVRSVDWYIMSSSNLIIFHIQAVMVDLVKRYIMSRQNELQTEEVTEDDLQEIKQDISAFRYELLEILRKGKSQLRNKLQEIKQAKSACRYELLEILWKVK